MKNEMKKELADSIKLFHLPRYAELSDVGLYLEQTTKYINQCLAPLGCVEFSGSMISNYVKKGLVPNPVKKQYSADHIALLFFIAIVKNLVAMENIGLLFDIQRASYPLPVAYDYFCSELENVLFFIFGLKDTMEKLGSTQSDEKDMLSNLIYSAAIVIHMNARFNAVRTEHETTA